MTERLPKKAMEAQRRAYDAACAELGLPAGTVRPGKGHWKYVTCWPAADDAKITVLIACTPGNGDFCLRQAKQKLRDEMRRHFNREDAKR